jgi:hypothetical protein
MRRFRAPATALGAGLFALALTACTPETAGIGAAAPESADHTTSAASRGASRTDVTLSPSPSPTPSASPAATTDPNVISFEGTHGVRIGQSIEELTAAGAMAPASPGCARPFSDFSYADPVFDNEKLAFIWAYPPLHTPEGVMVGTEVAALHDAYPTAERLTPPAGSPTFDGALVRNPNGVAYLILHDGDTVQKLIVGREDSLRMLYTNRLDTC